MNRVMNRVELEAIVAERKKLSKTVVAAVLQEIQEVILERLRGQEQVRIVGFGMFYARVQKERKGKNPKTGEPILIPAGLKPAFRAGKNLIEALNLPAKRPRAPAKRARTTGSQSA